jgi:shikimate dehydrogenase
MGAFKLLAITGRPVLHSLSPVLQNAGLRALRIEGAYVRLAAETADQALESARRIGMTGLNVTAPFKEDMFARVEPASEAARETRAVNTVVLWRGRAVGLNTDVPGVLDSLRERRVLLKGSRALVLGAGGAAASVVLALKSGGADVVVANRTPARATALARRFGCEAVGLSSRSFPKVAREATLVVGTLATADRVIDPEHLSPEATVFDAYYARPSALVRDAEKRGCAIIDGREWLLHQGARAFQAFTGRAPPVAAMRRALYAGSKAKHPRNVALVGPMGAGKSTIGVGLARELGFRWVDTDDRVVAAARRSIAEIFEAQGEAYFRKLERRAVAQVCAGRRQVIACGGGAVLAEANVRAMKEGALVIWLAVRPEVAVGRMAETGSRPMLKGNAVARARSLARERLPRYVAAADLVIDTEGGLPEVLGKALAFHWQSIRR